MQLTIFKRMAVGHLVLMFFVLFMGVYVVVKLGQLSEINREVARVDGVIISTGEKLQEVLFSLLGFEKKYAITADPDFYQQFRKMEGVFREELGILTTLGPMPWMKPMMEGVEASFAAYSALSLDTAASAPELENRESLALRIYADLKKLILRARMERDRKVALSDGMVWQVVKVITTTMVLTLVVGVLLSFHMTRSIVRPITMLKGKTMEIAQGSFHKIPLNPSPPEIRALAENFNTMSERLEALDDLKREFLSHVSHELRTPLTSIKAASGLLAEDAFKDSPEKRSELFTIIQSECERLIGTVDRILELSRMEAGMMDYHLTRADLGGVIRMAVLKLAPLSQKRQIDLGVKPLPSIEPVLMDPDRVSQVIDNLLGNALKYTPERGKISVEASVDDERGFAQVSISDNGIGIPRESLERIFERFKRVTSGNRIRGTGLGLSISKHIIEDHGGRIWAESTPGQGSTFCFTLPLA